MVEFVRSRQVIYNNDRLKCLLYLNISYSLTGAFAGLGVFSNGEQDMGNKQGLHRAIEGVLQKGGYESVSLAYLFGSRGRELNRDNSADDALVGPLSDYDVGIFTSFHPEEGSDLASPELFKLQSKLARVLDSEVDLLLLNRAPTELQYNVVAVGVLLYERSVERRVEYEARVLGRYGDYLPVLRRQREEIIQGGADEARVQRYRQALGKTKRVFE